MMKSYKEAASSNELQTYRFILNPESRPQYAVGLKFRKLDENVFEETLFFLRNDQSDFSPQANVKVLTDTRAIPSQLFTVAANLLGIVQKYSLGIVDNPKELENLGKTGIVTIFQHEVK